jgi:hypothetical protein
VTANIDDLLSLKSDHTFTSFTDTDSVFIRIFCVNFIYRNKKSSEIFASNATGVQCRFAYVLHYSIDRFEVQVAVCLPEKRNRI